MVLRPAALPEWAGPLVFLRQAAEPQFELEVPEQPALRPEPAEQQAAQPAFVAQEELLRASPQPEEPQASGAELPPLPSFA